MDILIISRDEDVRAIVAAHLRRDGYRVRELAEPEHVVQQARGCSLVITDYPTFTAGGSTVTALLRSHADTRNVKILNATTHATWSEIKGAAAEGADATIALPAGLSQLTLLVRRLLGDATPQRDGLS